MDAPLFLEPKIAPLPPRAIDPRDQREFDDCGTCVDCQNMLELGLVSNGS